MAIEELVSKCKEGDHEAITLLYNLYVPKLKASAMHIVHDESVVQDIVHDAFIILLSSLNTLKDNKKIAGWMNRIVVNLSYAYLKSKDSRMIPLEQLDADILAERDIPQAGEIPPEVLKGMMDKLPDRYQKVFRLYVLEGRSHQEISEMLHIKPHTSSSMLFVAKAKLKRMIVTYRSVVWLLPLFFLSVWYILSRKVQRSAQMVRNVKVWIKDRPSSAIESDERISLESRRIAKKNGKENKSFRAGVLANADEKKKYVPSDSVKVIFLPDTTEMAEDTAKMLLPLYPSNSMNKKNYAKLYSGLAEGHVSNAGGWTFSLNYGLMASHEMGRQALPYYYSFDNLASDVQPVTDFKDWGSYLNYLNTSGLVGVKENILKAIAAYNKGNIHQHRNFNMPFVMEVTAGKALGKRWNIAAGISYTQAGSHTVTGENGYCTMEEQNIQYAGLLLKESFTLYSGHSFAVYISSGIKLDIPFHAHSNVCYMLNGKTGYRESLKLSAPLQWSVNAGMGLQYDLTPSVGLFLEPSMNFYIHPHSKVNTIFNAYPINVTLPLGIRIRY